MMKTKNLLLLLAIASIMIFTSCKKDETPALTKEEATVVLNSVDDEFAATNTEISNNSGQKAIDAFYNLPTSPFGDIPLKAPKKIEEVKNLASKYKSIQQIKSGGGEDFIDFAFNEHKGTWTYNSTDYTWSHTSTPTDKVVIIFTNETKTVTLTYYDYQSGTSDGETYVKALKFKVEISGETTPVYSWEYSANRNLTGGDLTMLYTFGKFTEKQTFSSSFSISNSGVTANVSFLFELKKEGVILFSQSANINLSGTSETNATLTINAKIIIKNLVINYSINTNSSTNIEGDPSKFMTITVSTTSGNKVADVIFKYEELKWVPYFKFSDGTEAKIETYLSGELYDLLGEFIDSLFYYGIK